MRVHWQPGLTGHDGHWSCTCDTKDAGNGQPCALKGFTLGVTDYPTLDLAPYYTRGRKPVKAKEV